MATTAQSKPGRSLDPAPSGPLRVGFVGCGFVTRDRHLPTLRRVPEVDVVALCDVDTNALEAVADGYGVTRRYRRCADLVNDPEVEAVAVCVPAAAHVEVALTAVEAGKHVLVEKPLALALEEADRLAERCEGSTSKVMVGFNLRWHRHLLRARDAVATGELGRLGAVRSVFSDPRLSRPGAAWRARRELGGGALVDRLAHHFDLWRFLLGDEVEEVFALTRSGQAEDEAVSVTGRMRGGALASALGMDDTASSHVLDLYGDRGSLHVDCYRFDGLTRMRPGELPGAPSTRVRRGAAMLRDTRANLAAIRRGGDFNATYDAQWRAFAETVRDDRPVPCGLADGRAALEIGLAAAASGRREEPVAVAAPSLAGGRAG